MKAILLRESSSSSFSPYYHAATLLAVGLAVTLALFGELLFAAAALAVAVASFLSTQRLTRLVAKANEQKCHLDEQLIQSQKLAAIGELSSGIAHEINNPLAIMGQETEWIKHLLKGDNLQAPGATEELRDSLREIVGQVDRCKEITHKLLDFARKKEPLIQGADVNRLIEDMARAGRQRSGPEQYQDRQRIPEKPASRADRSSPAASGGLKHLE